MPLVVMGVGQFLALLYKKEVARKETLFIVIRSVCSIGGRIT